MKDVVPIKPAEIPFSSVISVFNGKLRLATYEQQVSYAAVDAGADLVVGDHAHMLKGIEQYKGKTIFHNLGDFGLTHAERKPDSQGRQGYSPEFKRMVGGPFFFESDGKENLFPLPEVDLTIVVKCIIEGGKISKVSYLPGSIDKDLRPSILKKDNGGQRVFDFVENITRGAGLNARFEWDGDEVVIHGD